MSTRRPNQVVKVIEELSPEEREETAAAVEEAMKEIDRVIDFKRVAAPQNVIDEINRLMKERGIEEELVSFVITVPKDAEVTDQLFLDAMKWR